MDNTPRHDLFKGDSHENPTAAKLNTDQDQIDAHLPDDDQFDAIDDANNPDSSNPFATLDDIVDIAINTQDIFDLTVRSIFIPIEWAEDGASPPDGQEIITHGSAKTRVRKFAYDSSEDIIIPWELPVEIDTSKDIRFRVCGIITESTAMSNQGVSFKIAGYAVGDGEDIDGSGGDGFGAEVEAKIAYKSYTQYSRFKAGYSAAISITDIANNKLVFLKLYRDHDDSDDTYEYKVGVTGIEITYKAGITSS